MRATTRKLRAAVGHVLENLEERRMLAWGPYPQLIDQDVAATAYPQYNGAGQVIVDLDSGINFRHPALAGRIWTNPNEIAGNGRDDDSDGLIDNVHGWDYVNSDNNPTDDQGHGTMTAGIMVANRFINTGNSRGYAGDGATYQGIAPGAKVIAMKVVDPNLRFNIYKIEAALKWVIANRGRHNITAVNMSLDVGGAGYSVIKDELATLWDAGVFTAAASGNGGTTNNVLAWPAASPDAAAIGAINLNNTITWLTTRGPSLDLLAPGNGVLYLSQGTDYYVGGAGTSYATPFGTAAAVLIKQVKPSFTNDEIVQILKDSGASIYDPASGLTFKRLDVDNAIALAIKRAGLNVAPLPLNTPQPSQSPFQTLPFAVPGVIEAEDFDNGAEGVAYHDSTGTNDGGNYRKTGVDIQGSADASGFYNICNTKAGEWLEYTIEVAATGYYDFSARVASYDTGGRFHVEIDGVDVTGAMSVPKTGGWQTWQTIARQGVRLSQGRHVLRLSLDAVGVTNNVGNFNWLKFTPSTSSAPAPSPSPEAPPPTTFQAESYIAGSGIVKGSTGLSYVDAGDWAEYGQADLGGGAGTFTVRVAVADSFAGRAIELRADSINGPVLSKLTVQGTGGWGIYKEQSVKLAAPAGLVGKHKLFLTFSGGDGVGNIDWFRVAPSAGTDTSEPAPVAKRWARSNIQTEGFDAAQGINKGSTGISWVDEGDWVKYGGVDFGGGVSSFTMRLAVGDGFGGKTIELRVGGVTGKIIGTLKTASTGGWGAYREQTAAIAGISGVWDLYLTFAGGGGVGNMDYFRFG